MIKVTIDKSKATPEDLVAFDAMKSQKDFIADLHHSGRALGVAYECRLQSHAEANYVDPVPFLTMIQNSSGAPESPSGVTNGLSGMKLTNGLIKNVRWLCLLGWKCGMLMQRAW